MPRRYYSSTAQETTLSSGINNTVATITVGATTGFPGSFPYTLILDPDTASEEVVTVTSSSGLNLTVTRGSDGTTAVSHLAGAKVRHGVSARDFDEPNAFINTAIPNSALANSSITVNGSAISLGGSVTTGDVTLAGTQTLTNKTLTSPVINTPIIALATNAQTGVSYTLALGDQTDIVELNNASAITLTVPTDASVAFPVGTQINLLQTGAGQVTVVGASGVTVNSEGAKLKLKAQWAAATLVKRATNSWVLFGNTAA